MRTLHEPVTLAVPIMDFGETAHVLRFDEESRVVHAKRREDFFFEEFTEALAREALHDVALNVD